LARLAADYGRFLERGAEILAIGPDDRRTFESYWNDKSIPFVGLPDSGHRVASLYKQQVRIFRLGRMPMVCIVDRDGRIRYSHYGSSMSDIPGNGLLLGALDEINQAIP